MPPEPSPTAHTRGDGAVSEADELLGDLGRIRLLRQVVAALPLQVVGLLKLRHRMDVLDQRQAVARLSRWLG